MLRIGESFAVLGMIIRSKSGESLRPKAKPPKSRSFESGRGDEDSLESESVEEVLVFSSSDELISVDAAEAKTAGNEPFPAGGAEQRRPSSESELVVATSDQVKLSLCRQKAPMFEPTQDSESSSDSENHHKSLLSHESTITIDDDHHSMRVDRENEQLPNYCVGGPNYRRILIHKSKGDAWCMAIRPECRMKDENGVEVVGTKIIEIESSSCYAQQLTNLVNPGDELVEWNEFRLRGLSSSSVMRLIRETSGEAELVIRSSVGAIPGLSVIRSTEPMNLRATQEGSVTLSEPIQFQTDDAAVESGVSGRHHHQVLDDDDKSSDTSNSLSLPNPIPRSRSSCRLTTMEDDEIERIKSLRVSRVHTKKLSQRPTSPSKSDLRGALQLAFSHSDQNQELEVRVIRARGLLARDINGLSDPYVKLYLLPGRDKGNKRKTKYVPRTLNPEWNELFTFSHIHREELQYKTLELSVWDYDRITKNDFIGITSIQLADQKLIDGSARWYELHTLNSR